MNVLIVEDDPRKERIPAFTKALKRYGRPLVTWAKTPREGIALLRSGQVDVLFLDHDLKGEAEPSGPGTGFEVAEWLANHPRFMPSEIYIHSLNVDGQLNMKRVLPEAINAPAIWEIL